MTMTDPQFADDLEARIAALEARLGTVQPLAAAPVTVGDLTNVPQPLAPITSLWAQQSTARTIGRYATPTARTNAWNASAQPLAKGTGSYLAAGDATEGPEWYNGTAWRKPWNMPWGIIGSAVGGDTGFALADSDVPGLAVAFTAVTGRLYRTIAVVGVVQNTQAATVFARVTDAANVAKKTAAVTIAASGYSGQLIVVLVEQIAAGAATRKARVATSAATGNVSGAGSMISVEDIGPAGAPT